MSSTSNIQIEPGTPVDIIIQGKTVKALFIKWNYATGAAFVNYQNKEIERTIRDAEGKPIKCKLLEAVPGQKQIAEFSVTERFQFLQDFAEMTLKGTNHALVVAGEGGLGKTHTILSTATKLGLKEATLDETGEYGEGDYVIIKGSSTAKALFNSMYKNRERLIIYDDCDSVLKDAAAVNILKGGLDSYERRIISWLADIQKNPDVPMQFEFEGTIIFLTNMKLKQLPQALLSRAMFVDVSMTQPEKFERMRMIAPTIENGVELSKKLILIDYLEALHLPLNDLNMRTFNKCCMLVREFEDWKPRVKYLVVSV